MVRLSRVRGARLGLGALAFAAVTLATYPIARYQMFTGWESYDDEGYLLIALKSYLTHGRLYDQISAYGPFYYEFWGGVFSSLGITVNHDTGRMATMVVWLLSSLLIGLYTWRMTASICLGLATQMIAFGALASLAVEPMAAGGTAVMLVVSIATISCFVRDRTARFSIALLGGAVVALVLVKVNVGIFAFVAVVLACVVTYPALAQRRWLRPAIEGGFVALPLLLMSSKAGEAWARQYAAHVAVAAIVVVIALRTRATGRRESKELRWLCGGLLVVGMTSCLAIIATGTSISGLIDGNILGPLRFAGSTYSNPLRLPSLTYVVDLLALLAAAGYWYSVRHRERRPTLAHPVLVSGLSILVGFYMMLTVVGRSALVDPGSAEAFQLGLLPFIWVALIEPPGKPDEATQFARVLLTPLAVLQALHAYPVAGSQVLWSALLLVPVGALCFATGVRGLAFSLDAGRKRRALSVLGAIAASVAMVALVLVPLKQELDHARADYQRSVSLGLPGAEDVRVARKDAATYQAIVGEIVQHCKSLVMNPEMQSFYFWTQQEPPTNYVTSAWGALTDDAYQQRVIEATRSIEGLCLLENDRVARFWTVGAIPQNPLVRYLHSGFVPIAAFGDYQLLQRATTGGGS